MAESLWTLPFGKFKGKDIEDVPTYYLNYLLCQGWFGEKYPGESFKVQKELDYRDRFDIVVTENA